MNDIMVSIRIPESLLLELKAYVEKEHFMDMSEAVRNIVRKKWLYFDQPQLGEIKKIREDIKEGVKKKSEKIVMGKIFEELEKIKEQIKEEGLIR